MASALDAGRVDAKTIAVKMNRIRESLSGLPSIKRQVRTIEGAAGKIRVMVDEVTDAAKAALDDVDASLKKTDLKRRRRTARK